MAGWFNVAPEEELSPGQTKVIDVDNVMIAVFNLDGEYHAIEDVCTHDEPLCLAAVWSQNKSSTVQRSSARVMARVFVSKQAML